MQVVSIPVALIHLRSLENNVIHSFSSGTFGYQQLRFCRTHTPIPKWSQSFFAVGKEERAADVEEDDFDGHVLRLLRQALLSLSREVEIDCWSNQKRQHH